MAENQQTSANDDNASQDVIPDFYRLRSQQLEGRHPFPHHGRAINLTPLQFTPKRNGNDPPLNFSEVINIHTEDRTATNEHWQNHVRNQRNFTEDQKEQILQMMSDYEMAQRFNAFLMNERCKIRILFESFINMPNNFLDHAARLAELDSHPPVPCPCMLDQMEAGKYTSY